MTELDVFVSKIKGLLCHEIYQNSRTHNWHY